MLTAIPVAPWLEGFAPLDETSVARTEVVTPGMCGHNSLLIGQIGDWTWDAVTALCGTDVCRARSPSGSPAYLSFYYYRVRGSRRFHLRTPTFGDRLDVTSQLYDFGSESVLTLHRIGLNRRAVGRAFTPDEFYRFRDDGCLYVETYNRWITRSEGGTNVRLVAASPPDFRHDHLPPLPDVYSPRHVCHRAKAALTFEDSARFVATVRPLTADYTVDIVRDLNGVGLLYFAAYWSIVDWALLQLWREMGRDDRSFLERVVVDQQVCYLGNADAGSVIRASVQHRTGADAEIVDVVLRDRDADRLLAISTLRLVP